MNWKNMQVSLQIQTYYRGSFLHLTGLLYRFWKIPRKTTAVDSYFNTVIVLEILLKQDPTTGILVKTFQNFQNSYFLCNTSRRLILNVQTILIVPAPFLDLFVYKDKKRRKVDQFRLCLHVNSLVLIEALGYFLP